MGPNGKIYATLDDVSEDSLAQQRDAMAGKIVRLELDGSVPEDNPFDPASDPVVPPGVRRPPRGAEACGRVVEMRLELMKRERR